MKRLRPATAKNSLKEFGGRFHKSSRGAASSEYHINNQDGTTVDRTEYLLGMAQS